MLLNIWRKSSWVSLVCRDGWFQIDPETDQSITRTPSGKVQRHPLMVASTSVLFAVGSEVNDGTAMVELPS